MPVIWFICPYDVRVEKRRLQRSPSIRRYIPTHPRPDGAEWSEVEILGNHILVKVSAPQRLLNRVSADPDFTELPDPIPVTSRTGITNILLALGYTQTEIDDTRWVVPTLLRVLASKRSPFRVNATRSGLELLPGIRVPGNTIDNIEARVR